MSKIEEIVSLFGETLETIRRYQACDFYEDRKGDCSCAGCQAKWVLERVGYDWRSKIAMDQLGMEGVEPVSTNMRGAGPYPDRLNWHARERRLVGAFLGDTVHQYFNQIIGHEASLRDWRTAIGVVRWLGTNVGSGVLETAGWRYRRYKEDREQEPKGFGYRALKNWTHGLGWLVSVVESSWAIEDKELHRLASRARDTIQAVINHLNMRTERETEGGKAANEQETPGSGR